jgi:hypothetical protein
MAGSVLPAARTYKGCDRRFRNAGFDDDLDDVANGQRRSGWWRRGESNP